MEWVQPTTRRRKVQIKCPACRGSHHGHLNPCMYMSSPPRCPWLHLVTFAAPQVPASDWEALKSPLLGLFEKRRAAKFLG